MLNKTLVSIQKPAEEAGFCIHISTERLLASIRESLSREERVFSKLYSLGLMKECVCAGVVLRRFVQKAGTVRECRAFF